MNTNPSNKRKLPTTRIATPSKIRKIKTKKFVKSADDDNQTKININKPIKIQKNIKRNGKNQSKGKKPKKVVEEDSESMDESNTVESSSSSEELNHASDVDSEAEVNSNDNDDSDCYNDIDEESENETEENELDNSTVVSNNGSNLEEQEDTDDEENDNSGSEENDNSGSEENDNSGSEENDNSHDEENDNSDNEENDNSDDEENDNTNDEENVNDTDEELDKNAIEEENETHNQSVTSNSEDFQFNSTNSVFVRGIVGTSVNDIFSDCNIDTFHLLPNKFVKDVINAIVKFKDNESYKNALLKNECTFNGSVITIKPYYNQLENAEKYKFCVGVEGVPRNVNISDIFKDCQIKRFSWPTRKNHGILQVWFENVESVKKALSKDGLQFNGNILRIRYRCFDKCVYIRGLRLGLKVEDIFKDCKIIHYESTYNPTYHNKSINIYFEDEKSVEKALLKNNTDFDGHILDIKRKGCILFATGLKTESTIDKLFNKEEIFGYKLFKRFNGEFEGTAIVFFKNRESKQNALQKSGTIIDDQTVFLTFYDPRRNNFQKPTPIQSNNYKFKTNQRPTYNYNKFKKYPKPTHHNNTFKKIHPKATPIHFNNYNNKFKKNQYLTPTHNNKFKIHGKPTSISTNNYDNNKSKIHKKPIPTNNDNKLKKKLKTPIPPTNKKPVKKLLIKELLKQTSKIKKDLKEFDKLIGK